MFFITSTFPQNMVRGGIPPILQTITVGVQNAIWVVMSFIFNPLKNFSVIISDAEYIARNV